MCPAHSRGVKEARAAPAGNLGNPCAPLGLPPAPRRRLAAVAARSSALEGIGSRWPHYFPLNQPKEGFSEAAH